MTTPRVLGERLEQPQAVISEKVVDIRRVSKVVKGGRHLRFSALAVAGDGQGRVGVGLGKAEAIPDAIRKGAAIAQKHLVPVVLNGSSIPHEVKAKYGAAIVLLKPAPSGTGIIAGASMRAVLELAGVRDVVAKSLKSQNPINVVRATMEALRQLRATEYKRPSRETAVTVEEPGAPRL